RGERRFVPRLRPLSLERLAVRRFFSRFVRAGTAMEVHIAIEARPDDVLSQKPARVRLVDRALEDTLQMEEFAADVDVGDLRADGVAANRTAFNQEVRIALHQQMILERARFALVSV